MSEKTAATQIDDIIAMHDNWKGQLLAQIREAVLASGPVITEEIKWKMATRPEGLAVWTSNGIICFAEIWKDNVKLLFPKGAKLTDDDGLFNARLNSKDIRAIEFHEGDALDVAGLQKLVRGAAETNETK